MSKIFVRERGNIGKGAGTPRFEIVAVTGVDLKVYHSHIRRLEVEKIAAEIGAEIVDLPHGGAGEKGEAAAGKAEKADAKAGKAAGKAGKKKRAKARGRQKDQG